MNTYEKIKEIRNENFPQIVIKESHTANNPCNTVTLSDVLLLSGLSVSGHDGHLFDGDVNCNLGFSYNGIDADINYKIDLTKPIAEQEEEVLKVILKIIT